MIRIGRIAIKNRVKSFNIDILKFNMLYSHFKIEVCNNDSILRCHGKGITHYEMVGNKATIPIGVTESTYQHYVYLKFMLFEDQEVHEEEDLLDKYLKVTIQFGVNNFNKSIKETVTKKANNLNRTALDGEDDDDDYQQIVNADGTIDTEFRPEGVPSSLEIQ